MLSIKLGTLFTYFFLIPRMLISFYKSAVTIKIPASPPPTHSNNGWGGISTVELSWGWVSQAYNEFKTILED